MEPSFDLDINNYTANDLLQFFKLDDSFSIEDLFVKAEKLATEILSVDNKKYNPKYKFDIINFINLAKDVLKSFRNDMESNKEMKKNLQKFSETNAGDPRAGRIINPLASHPALEHSIIPKHNINGYNYDTITSIYVFNTSTRNDFYTTVSSDSTFDLPLTWTNVISITLSSVTIPNVMYAFNKDRGNIYIYIEEDNTGISGIVSIPSGNYVPFITNSFIPLLEASFPEVLELAINNQLLTGSRFKVSIDLSNRKTTISNTTNTFSMNTLNKPQEYICNHKYPTDFGENPLKELIDIETYVSTLAYSMGFRELSYEGLKSYTSESIFDNRYSDYLYFVLEDFTGSQPVTETYGMLGGKGTVRGNILGVIPINSSIFVSTFDNGSNFIYKKREYFGPVDISRIKIKLINQKGNIVNLEGTTFNFSLQVKTIYNLTQKSKINLRGAGPF